MFFRSIRKGDFAQPHDQLAARGPLALAIAVSGASPDTQA